MAAALSWLLPWSLPIGVSCTCGLVLGFGRHWKDACLVACGAVPLVVSGIIAVLIPTTILGKLMWGVMYFLGLMISTFLAWGVCAGIHHGAHKLYLKIFPRVRDRRGSEIAS
jgi:hypothetical protein